VTAPDLASVRVPPTSIIDGRPDARVITVCCLNTFHPSRVRLAIPVDEPTARRLLRTCREFVVLMRWFAPAALVSGLAAGAAGIAGFPGGYWLMLAVAALALLVGVAHRLRRSRHHPVLVRRGHVLVRGVHPETARAWAALNPGAIELFR
jgi:hypothetical protein